MTIKTTLLDHLATLSTRRAFLGEALSEATIMETPNLIKSYSKEYADLEEIVETFQDYLRQEAACQALEPLLADPEDAGLRALAEEEQAALQAVMAEREQTLYQLLTPKDPNDSRNIFLEIRAGTGGSEASLFAGDLSRMYLRFAENQRWRTELVHESPGEQGGYKEVIIRILGKDVYSKLKFESGAHRVQRVPATESQGRIHTSACTVAVLPEVAEIDAVILDPSDLRVDTFRASGAGGQHVNRTDSAVRITHIPTGVVVECQDERSQHKNRARAMSLLQSRILAAQRAKQQSEQASQRRSLVGSGDRSERIRTYNFPQGRVTDHRINLTLYHLVDILEGRMLPLIDPLIREYQTNPMND